ncbi:hypothetical protein CEXT_297181 [Caerostris extrusa]|uniref:Uncharacterized protein n=1 Tax=Caerostris extrusa TaxID=172846 RepID=A0AAV4MER0_CAEEX|nr:hypothetical protein CEXT_297181 [Caerostris extrusa]
MQFHARLGPDRALGSIHNRCRTKGWSEKPESWGRSFKQHNVDADPSLQETFEKEERQSQNYPTLCSRSICQRISFLNRKFRFVVYRLRISKEVTQPPLSRRSLLVDIPISKHGDRLG